jgi:hypothetical protein
MPLTDEAPPSPLATRSMAAMHARFMRPARIRRDRAEPDGQAHSGSRCSTACVPPHECYAKPGSQSIYAGAGQSAYPESVMEPVAIACSLPPVESDDRLGAGAVARGPSVASGLKKATAAVPRAPRL